MGEYEIGVKLPQWEQLPDIGLYMDQVVTLMDQALYPALPKGEMTKSMVNNYVKVGLLPRPTGKKYDREHLALLLMIAVLKQALSMEHIAAMLPMLCAQDVHTGYERFRMQGQEIEAALDDGHAELYAPRQTDSEQALHLALLSALCGIRTRQILYGLSNK